MCVSVHLKLSIAAEEPNSQNYFVHVCTVDLREAGSMNNKFKARLNGNAYKNSMNRWIVVITSLGHEKAFVA